MPFIAKALMHGIRTKPVVNSSVINDGIQYHKNVNIGIAVALEWGLIVPVVKGAENLSFVGLQRAITDLGERARGKNSSPMTCRAAPSPHQPGHLRSAVRNAHHSATSGCHPGHGRHLQGTHGDHGQGRQ